MDTYKLNCFENLCIILCYSEFIMKINIHVIIIIKNDEVKSKNTMALISNNNI